MHASNSDSQNVEITEMLGSIERLWRQAMRRSSSARAKLSEGFSEVLWKGNNLPYRQAIRLLRHAETAFADVVAAPCVADAMGRFTVRPDEDRRWVRAPRSAAKTANLPAGAIVLLPARPGAARSFALAA